jgi:hypothetical protein
MGLAWIRRARQDFRSTLDIGFFQLSRRNLCRWGE